MSALLPTPHDRGHFDLDGADLLHARKVERIVEQLRGHRGPRPVSFRKKAVAHQVPKRGDLRRFDDKIDLSELTSILAIDPAARTCVAESGVTFVDLVTATLRHGLVPKIVPEFKTITIGGAVTGCSIESASFEHGGFHDTCRAYEVITGRGDVLSCTPDNENSLVFQMIHGSFGTLGILTKLQLDLVPAKPFVKLTYEEHPTLADYQAAIHRHSVARDVDFMDGFIHSPTKLVLCLGRFVDEAPYRSRYDWIKIYWQSTATRTEDYMTTVDYFFRYDRGVVDVRPRSLLGRLLLGRFITTNELLRLAERLDWLLEREASTMTLDVFLPFSKVPDFFAWYEREIGHFPLWCVPYRRVHDYEWLDDRIYATMKDDLFVDLAIYGLKQPPGTNYHKLVEARLRELGGVKTLIDHNYYTRDEFWQTWNKPNYDKAKAITDPDNLFRDLWAKTCRAAMGVEE